MPETIKIVEGEIIEEKEIFKLCHGFESWYVTAPKGTKFSDLINAVKDWVKTL